MRRLSSHGAILIDQRLNKHDLQSILKRLDRFNC